MSVDMNRLAASQGLPEAAGSLPEQDGTSSVGTVGAVSASRAGRAFSVSSSDLESLVEQLRLEHEDCQRSLVTQQFASTLARLVLSYSRFSAVQAAALEAVGKATDDVSLKKAQTAAAGAAAAAALALVTAEQAELASAMTQLDLRLKDLDAFIEAERKTSEKRKKELQEKEARAEIVSERVEEKERLEAEIAALKAKVAALQASVAKKTDEALAATGAYTLSKVALSSAEGALAAALSNLDKVGIPVLAEAVRLTALQVKLVAEEREDAQADVDKANEIIALAEELRQKSEEEKAEDLEKLIAKLPDALTFIAGAEKSVAAEEWPGCTLQA